MLEAMSAGVPVVCGENPGTAAVIQHMVNGIKVRRSDLEEAAEHIYRIFEEPELAGTLSSRARADAESKFDIRVTAGEYERLFRQLTTAKAGA
jgi:glycosyltransferase involved in cell wall biosynthesis